MDGYPPAWVPERAVEAWCAVANAAAAFQPVTMLVNPEQVAEARRRVSAAVELLPLVIDDAWLRDSGPTFVLDDDGRLGAVDWIFNGWGARSWARWDHDALVAGAVGEAAAAAPIVSTLVNEGGGILVDGRQARWWSLRPSNSTPSATRTPIAPGLRPSWPAPSAPRR